MMLTQRKDSSFFLKKFSFESMPIHRVYFLPRIWKWTEGKLEGNAVFIVSSGLECTWEDLGVIPSPATIISHFYSLGFDFLIY